MARRFNILSLSGGGYLGLYTIAILESLEEQFGAPIAKSFDLIAGTSIGGITALALAAEIPACEIREAFQKNGGAIFPEHKRPTSRMGVGLELIRSLSGPKYQAQTLRDTIVGLVGADMKIGDLRHPVMVPTVNLTKGAPQVFKTPHHANFVTDQKLFVADVAVATSAAPTFFELAQIGNQHYADGGLYANSPDLMALHEAEHFMGAEDVHMLSIGTTTAQFSFSHVDGRQFGLAGWMKDHRLISVMIASQQKMTSYMMGHKLGSHYLRLDAAQSKEQQRDLALDVAKPAVQHMLIGLADSTAQEYANNLQLKAFFQHQGQNPSFYKQVA